MTFTASVQKQIGTATITTRGITFHAMGGVSSVTEIIASEIAKFQVTPASSAKAILRFELNTGQPPAQFQVSIAPFHLHLSFA